MQPDDSRFLPYFIAVLAVFLVYRRLRRNFGRQPVRPVRMGVRIGILGIIGCCLLFLGTRSLQFLAADLVGAMVGTALGIWGARRTRYQNHGGRLYYIPHTYTGLVVSLLLVGRLAYRFAAISSLTQPAGLTGTDSMQGFPPPAMVRSPVTGGLLFVVIGYYVCYYGMVLRRSKNISPEDLEVSSTSTAALP